MELKQFTFKLENQQPPWDFIIVTIWAEDAESARQIALGARWKSWPSKPCYAYGAKYLVQFFNYE